MEDGLRALRVTVPATSANLGAGFDVFGLALDLRNVFTLTPANESKIELTGYTRGLPGDETNLFYRAFSFLYERVQREVPALHIKLDVRIPPGKGLGSSATAVVGGLVAANAFLSTPEKVSEIAAALPGLTGAFDPQAALAQQVEERDSLFSRDVLLGYAIHLEHGHHADNVAPALLGGLVVNASDTDGTGIRNIALRVPFPGDLKAVLLLPDFEMDTVQGRALMPREYSKEDVVFSTGRVALFLSALNTGRYDLLRVAMQDRIHQPYRAQMFRILPTLVRAALEAGAHGACLSGGGSSVLALATGRAEEIGEAMRTAASAAGLDGEVRVLEIDREGARAEWIEEEDGP